MRYLLSLALALAMTAGAFADSKDEIRKFIQSQQANPTSISQDIKEFARYQTIRQRTYAEAVDQHNKTKCVVIVWVGFTDSDDLFKMWQQTKDLGYHIFVKDFEGVYTGVVIGRDFSGTFGRLGTITDNYVEKIKAEVNVKYTPAPQPRQNCVDGKCFPPLTTPFSQTIFPGGSYCPPGRSK